ncbi:MAG: mandelate racemase/muconate lactonizing enzyme family protein [Candidatus Poribacteria bacterium]|nr:mandelate racemase/muconate lactonizing enzyme family protein [Candidatus Poribacteria bacterium]
MKITGFEYRTISIPFIPAIQEHSGMDYPTTLIWVHTDEGLIGLGESNSLNSDITDQADGISEKYVGKNLWDIDLASESFALQCAFYDLAGQALGVPAHKLIGEKHRDSVELAYWSPPMPAEATAAEAERGANMGFRVHKLKARKANIVETACLIEQACGPDFQIRVDPNTEFGDLETGLRLAEELLPYNIEVYEDPIRFEDLSWYRQMREQVEVPVARHLGAPPGILENILAGAVDAVNMGGNVAGLRKSAAVAEAADLPIWVQIFAFGSCVASTFAAHIACTLPNCTMPIDELPHIRVDDLSGGSMDLSNGAINLSDAPGLGISLDMDAVERYRIR